MASFFKHENQLYSPSLSGYGKLRFAKKSDLMHILAQEGGQLQDPPHCFDSLDLEPPLPLYIGINVHTQTRSKALVTQLCQLGLSIDLWSCEL